MIVQSRHSEYGFSMEGHFSNSAPEVSLVIFGSLYYTVLELFNYLDSRSIPEFAPTLVPMAAIDIQCTAIPYGISAITRGIYEIEQSVRSRNFFGRKSAFRDEMSKPPISWYETDLIAITRSLNDILVGISNMNANIQSTKKLVTEVALTTKSLKSYFDIQKEISKSKIQQDILMPLKRIRSSLAHYTVELDLSKSRTQALVQTVCLLRSSATI
jgi:hypothetical protein